MDVYHISIVGTGYVGLSTAVAFASKGCKVIASTHNAGKADLINKGTPPFYELGLEKLLKKVVSRGFLRCVLGREEAILNTDLTFIAVATPSQPGGGIDLQHIRNSAREIGEALTNKKSYHLVVVKSTIIPGTTQNVIKPILEKHSHKECGVDFGLCMSPEFLREGSALRDTLYADRVVIGEYDKRSGDTLEDLHRGFYGEDLPPIIRTSLHNAELVKYANNAFLAMKVSFINQIANICEKIPDTDVTTIAKAIGLDKRIAPTFLGAGLGYGGSCFPKDVKALIAFCRSLDYDPKLLGAVEEVNRVQPYRAVELAKRLIGGLRGKRVAVLGLAFKPGTDDVREAVSVRVINKLLEEQARVIAYDPAAMSNAKEIFGDDIEYASSVIDCIKGADCCIVATEWEEFKEIKPERFVKNMRTPAVVDGRRIYDPKEFSLKLNFAAIGLG